MKKTRKILIAILVVIVSFCIYAQYIKVQFDKIYANRENYGMIYNDIYNSGKLELIKSFLFEHFDSVKTTKGFSERKFILYDIEEITKDTSILSAADYLMKKGFYRCRVEYEDEKGYSIEINRTFLDYKDIPTKHCLIYDESFAYEYQYSPNDNWFFYSFDDKLYDPNFLDLRPEWLLPYYEAFEFFKWNQDYKIDE